MAHITLKLIWYRLGETFDKMAAASENITAWLDWDDHLLDFLLIGWIGWAALVVVVVNSVLTFFGPLQPRGDFVIRTKEGATGAKVVAGTGGAESCLWLNSALNWFYLHYDKFPEFVDVWVKALNDQSAKLGGPVQVKFERVKSGSLPPKFSEVTFEAGPEDKYVVTCKTDSRDLSLAVFASQQTAEGVKLTNLTTNILKLKGTLKMKCFRDGSDMMVNVSFEGRPDVKVVGKPVNPYQDPNDLVDVGVVETVVRNAICLTSSNFNISKLLTGGSYGNLSPRIMADAPLSPGNRSPSNLSPRTEAVFEPIEVKEVQQSAFHSPGLLASAPRPSRPSPGEKRLLVKVIKASALGGRDVGSIDPTCVVILDSPPQTQATSVVKSTVNPFWDEQFLFDVSGNTRELKFEVRDRRRPAADNFLGEAYVYYEDLKRTPSSRQIIPLQGSPDIRGDMVTGSITVEFLFLDAIEAETVRQTIAAMSPKRTVEVNQAKTPGGTLVTKTTTTTERARHGRQGAQVDGSPNYIEKHTNMYDYEGSDSTSQSLKDRSVSSSSELLHINGVESVAETAIRELMDRSRKPRTPTKTSTLIITGVKRASTKPSEEITELPSAVTVPQAESSPVTETPSAVTVPQAESSPVTETPSAVTVPQAESSPVEETALSSDAVVEHFQQSSNTPSHTAKPLTPPTSECGFKPEISAQAESFPESSFPKFTPLGMHPPAEVKSFPDKKKDTSPNFESENKIAEMLSEPTPTIDLLDKNIVFEISYSLGDPEPTPTVFQLDSSHDMPTEDVQHKPDLISDSEIQSGHGASSEIPFASSSDREITSEVSSVPASDKDIGEDVNCVLSSGEDSSEQLTFLSTEIESSQDVEYDAAPQPIKESEKVNTHTEVDSCQEVALKSTCVEAVAHSRSPSPFADEVDSCQEVALTSSCVEVVAHSRSPSPFADDSSCSSFHDDEYISHSSTEDLADGTSPHYFKSMEVEASEWPEASTDTCLMSEKAFTETSHGEATAAVEQLEEDSAVTEKVFTQDLSVDVTHSPEPLEETEPEECAAVISKVFTPEPSDSLTFPPKTLEENDNDGAECAAVVADMFTPDSSEKLEISSDSITEDNIEEYAAVAAKVFTPESSEELELSPDPLKETDIEPLAETETEPVEYAAIAAKVFTPEPEEEPELLPEPLKETDIEPLAETETEPVEYAAIAAKVFTPEPEEEPELLPEPLKETDIEPLAETETEPVEYAAVAAKLFTPEPEEEPELLPEPLKETDIEPLAETETEPVEYAAVAAKMFTPEPDGLEPLKETDNEPLAETETEPVEYETVAAKMFTPEPKELEPLNETDNEPLGETETEPVEYEAVAARVFTPEPSDELELSPEPEAIAAVAPAQHSAVTSKILPESMVYTKGAHEEQAEAALTEHGQCSSSENVLLTKVEPSTQFVLEEATTSCPLLPAERVLAAQKIPSTETVLSETMPIETTLSADSIVQIEVESSDHCLSQTAKIDEDILLTEVEPSEQIAAEETTIPCSSVPAERLLASHTVSAVETVLSETLARETRLPADKLVQTEIKPSEEMSLEEAVLSSPSIPAERLLAAQKDSETETVLSETMPIETLLSVDASTVDVSAVVSREADIISSEYVVETEETPVVHTSKERAVSLEETEHPAVFSTRDTIVSTEQDYKEDDLSDYDDLPEDIPSDFLIEEMTEVLEVDTEDLAKFPVSIGDDLTDTHMDFEPVVVEPVHEDCEVEEAEDRTPTESMDQGEGIVTEDPCGETDIPSSDLMSVDRSGGEVNSELESEVSVAASDEAMPDKPLQLDLVSIPLLEEMEQIVSDMSSLAEDISKSPVLASDEFPFQPPCTTTDVVDQPSTEADIAEETPSSVTCHSAEVSMARDGAQEMSSEDTESSPVESLTPTPDDLDHSCHQSDLETAMVTVETFAGETALQPIKPQAIEETALEFSLASREEKASVSSVSDIIQDLPAHSTVTEQEPIVLQSSAVSVDVVTVSDPTPEELSAVDDLLQEVSDYSQLQHGSSGHDEGEDVYLTGQFVSEPVSEAELAAEACFVEDTRSHHVEGLSVNVFVTTDRETPEPSSPLAKYDVIEDLSVSIDEPFTVEDDETLESSILSVDATTEDISTRSDDVPSTVGSFDIPANAALEDLSIRPDTSFASENLPTEEVTSAFPAAEADISTEYEVSIPTQSEEKDDDSPAMRAILRRQNYLAEQAKKKELFEGSGRIEHDGAVDSCEKLVEILPVVGSELPQCLSCSDPMETKPTEGKVTTTSMYVDIKPCVQPFDNVPKTIVVQVESTEIAGPPKELVSDLMSGNRIATSPETYASLSRPLRVYKQVSSDIEDDTSKVIQKRVDDWVATTTDNVVATTPESSTVQTPVPSSQQPGSVILPQMTENIQVSPQLLSENVQSVHKTGFVIRPQVVENVQPSSENVKIVQRPGFATSRKTVENINIDPQPQPEYVQIVQRPGFAMSRQTVENINIDPQPENVQIVQRPGFAMTRQTAENINIDPQPQPENVQIVQRPGFAMSRQPAENINIDPQPQPENVQIVQRPGFAMSRQTDKNINIDPQPQTENVQIVQRPGFAMPLTVENLPHIPQPLSDNVQLPHEPESAENPDVEDVQISPETLADVESVPASGRVYRPKKYNTLPHPSKSSKDASTPKRAGSVPRSSSSADKHRKTTQSSPTEEANSDIPTVKMDPPTSGQEEKEKKKGSSLARTLKKRFSRSKKRSKSAERSRDDSHLQPPGQSYGQAQSKDDIELVRAQQDTPSLKKSRSLGGSLKKLFRRGRKRSRDQGETSRESSYSRSSTRNASQGPSREGSITRGGGPTSSLTRSGQLPDQKGEVGRSHWSRSNTQPTSNEYMEREVDVSPRHQPGDTTYPVLQQEPTVIQPRGISSHEPDVGRGHWSRPKSGEQLDVARQTYDTNSAPPESNTAPEDVRRGHWSKSKSPARGGAVIITSPKQEPLDVVSPSYDTMAAPPDTDEKPEVRRGHWSKSKSPARSAGGMVITSTRQEVPDLVSSSSTKVVTAEVNGKTKSLEKIEAPIQSGPVVVKQRESTEVDTNDKPVTMTTTAEVSDVQSDVRRGHWSKSKSPNRDRIGQIVVSKDPIIAVPVADADVRKGHWTKSKSKSPKREWAPPSGIETSVPDSQSPSDVHPSSTTESSDNIKVKAKPTRVEPVKSKPVKVVPVKAKPTKVESTVQEPVPEDLIVPPPPSAKKGHWSKTATDLNQPMGGGVIVVTTDPAEIPVVPVEPVDVRRGHWTKPKTQTS